MNNRSRVAAMKRYFKYADKSKSALSYPKKNVVVKIYNQNYNFNCFTDAYSVVLTFDGIGYMETYDEHCNDPYINIEGIFGYLNEIQSTECLININDVLEKAREIGYKFKKSELQNGDSKYFWKYRGRYYKVGIVDQAYSIINNEGVSNVICGSHGILFIDNIFGVAAIMPFHLDACNQKQKDEKIIIEL